MKKQFLKLFSTNWATYLMSAYLLYAIFAQFIYPVEDLYLSLNGKPTFISVFPFILFGAAILYAYKKKVTNYNTSSLFTILVTAYLLLTLFKSPSILISLAYLLLGIAIYFKLYLNQEQTKPIFLLGILVTLPRTLSLIYSSSTLNLGKFKIDTSSWDMNRVWLLFFILIYAIILSLLVQFVSRKWFGQLTSSRTEKILTFAVSLIAIAYISYLSTAMAYMVKTYSVSTFDFGIFTQMFNHMKESVLPLTTLERDKVLSHFAVHISPIFYFMLPFYMIWPYAETLEILQVIVVFSGIVPFYLILKKIDLPSIFRPFALLLFIATPTLTTSGSYHLHENSFLVPLLLWLIYANLMQWRKGLVAITLLTLMIKEDAFIYVLSVSLYFLLQNRILQDTKRKIFIIITEIIFPLIYFGICLFILNHYGQGAMVSRFDNFLLSGQKGLGHVIQNMFLNPTYTFSSLFTEKKLSYVWILLLSQAFLPLIQKRWENYILLIPLVVINLLSDYPYQANINFQYSYGSNILVLFMSVLALEAIYQYFSEKNISKTFSHQIVLQLTLVATLFSMGITYSYSKNFVNPIQSYNQNKKNYDLIHKTLEQIPRNKKVLAYAAYTIDLREVDKLYDMFYHKERAFDSSIDILVISQSAMTSSSKEREVVELYRQHGYKESSLSNRQVLVLEKP